MIEALKDADILLVGYEKVSEYVIKNLQKLKLIGCTRGNPINVDSKFAKSCRIPVIYTPARNANSAAEYTMGIILSEVRHIARVFYSLKTGIIGYFQGSDTGILRDSRKYQKLRSDTGLLLVYNKGPTETIR